MNDPNFPPHIRAALDRFDAPPLPDGFADRLLARIDAPALAPLPPLRKAPPSRWRRSGWIAGSIGLFGMVTAAAAATGIFGDPIYVPVVSEALAQAKIAPVPKAAKAQKSNPKSRVAKVAANDATRALPQDIAPTGKEKARTALQSLWRDPEFRALPREQRRRQAHEALQLAINTGDFDQAALKQAMQEMRAERSARREQRAAARPGRNMAERPMRRRAVTAQPDQKEATSQTLPMRPAIRARLQNASPEERAQIRERIRERRAARRAAQAIDMPLQPEATDPIAEPPK
jgi:hypothetical protein